MRQRIVIETEGEAPPLEDLSNIVRGVVVNTVLRYGVNEIRDFSIRREILPEETCGHIQMPEFLNRDEVIRRLRDGVDPTNPGKEVQDGRSDNTDAVGACQKPGAAHDG